MTNYGEEIVLADSQYTGVVSDTRIWVDQKIINLLEVRIRCYEDLAKQISGDSAGFSIPTWYSETITDWWGIAGLPHTITGNFSTPTGEIPAILHFHTGEENGDFLGWYLSISDNDSFTFFIDPGDSVGKIYSRRGKTPEQSKVRINCTLYVKPGISSAIEQRIIENGIKPFNRTDQEGIDIAITYNGHTFEIRESPPRHGSVLIFQGQ
jgi:hypothetical protein